VCSDLVCMVSCNIIVWSWALQSRPRPSRLRKTPVLMMPSLWMMMSLRTMMVRISAGLCSVLRMLGGRALRFVVALADSGCDMNHRQSRSQARCWRCTRREEGDPCLKHGGQEACGTSCQAWCVRCEAPYSQVDGISARSWCFSLFPFAFR